MKSGAGIAFVFFASLIFFTSFVSAAGDCGIWERLLSWFGLAKCGISYSPYTDNFGSSQTQTVCGNEIVEGGEECEGTDFNGKSCANFNFTSGNLLCRSDCTINSSGCFNICQDECSPEEAQCDGNSRLNCGDFNADGCLEFGNLTMCGDGFQCVEGACEQSRTCTDSDGDDYYAAGTCSDANGNQTDSCISGTSLREWTCNLGNCFSNNVKVSMCQNGVGGYGACLSNLCTFSPGEGENECTEIGETCGVLLEPQDNRTHLECVNFSCAQVNGTGDNECSNLGESCGAANGTLSVISTPSGASVYDGGVLKGVTPKSYSTNPGAHEIKLIKSEYLDFKILVNVNSSYITILNVTLERNETASPLENNSRPDLVVSSLSTKVGSHSSSGFGVIFTASVKNIGGAKARASMTGFRILNFSTNKTTSALEVGQSANVTGIVYVQSAGNYVGTAIADLTNSINESSETNNNNSVTFRIEEKECSDSDGGVNYQVRGTASDRNGDFTDSCEENKLTEYYCSEDSVINASIVCEGECGEGVCKIENEENSTEDNAATENTESLRMEESKNIFEKLLEWLVELFKREK